MSRIKPRRTPRRRTAPQQDAEWWEWATQVLTLRSRGRCERCGGDFTHGMERHHRMRRRDGGDRIANLLALCPSCHHHVTEHPADAYEQGWSIRALGDGDPLMVPVRLADGMRWLLDDKGGRRPLP